MAIDIEKKKPKQRVWGKILETYKKEIQYAVIFIATFLIFIGGAILLLNSANDAARDFSSVNQELEKEESSRYELVAKELNISKKHLLIESRLFSHLYDVNADGDHFTVEFNDDCTKIEKIVKE
ncbi:hypothetical protein ACFVL4_18825 [Bacillus subtilis]|uniref:hypothetical protein n=1 Tax=Bacillus subtilis TaxID=1423 RepID=UPI00059C6BC5|nr:hypothetical protein [Bacillus subtilis]KIN40254.1 hypothetical protein B4071_4374 [Bacillus subtilis]